MAIIEQIFVDFAKKIEGSVWPANFLGVMQKSHNENKPSGVFTFNSSLCIFSGFFGGLYR